MRTAIEPLLEQRSELHAEVERLLKERSELPAQVDRLWAALLVARRWIPESPISPIAAEDLRIVNEALRHPANKTR